jgi:hypothetical protein
MLQAYLHPSSLIERLIDGIWHANTATIAKHALRCWLRLYSHARTTGVEESGCRPPLARGLRTYVDPETSSQSRGPPPRSERRSSTQPDELFGTRFRSRTDVPINSAAYRSDYHILLPESRHRGLCMGWGALSVAPRIRKHGLVKVSSRVSNNAKKSQDVTSWHVHTCVSWWHVRSSNDSFVSFYTTTGIKHDF